MAANLDFFIQIGTRNSKTLIYFIQGVSYLCYPLIGWLADVRFTRFKVIFSSLVFNILVSCGSLAGAVWAFTTVDDEDKLGHLILLFLIVPGIVSLSMFEANAIQFGMDQLLEASSEQLSSFIHWYYWFSQAGRMAFGYVNFLLAMTVVYNSGDTRLPGFSDLVVYIMAVLVTAYNSIWILLGVVCLLVLYSFRQEFFIQRVGSNPLKMVNKVLRYSWKHTCPENRSAFTYWEEDVPPRIDLGKSKYGGPFTNEEVENVKTFLQLSLLIASLFGFHLLEDGNSTIEQMEQHSCPSLTVLMIAAYTRHNISSLTVVIAIPVYRCVRKVTKYAGYAMLARIKVGIVLSLILQILHVLLVLNQDQLTEVVPCYKKEHQHAVTNCLRLQLNFTYTKPHCYPCIPYNNTDNTYIFFIVPHFLNG